MERSRLAFRTLAVFVALLLTFSWVYLLPPRISETVETLGGVLPLANQVLATWVITHLLGLPPHSSPPPVGDPLAPVVLVATLLVTSLVIATAWSTIARGPTRQASLWPWLHLAARWSLAAVMLSYGWAKVMPRQYFDSVRLDMLTEPAGQMSPYGLLWATMEASRSYAIFTGTIELLAGVLLLTRRTSLLGGLLTMAALVNVLALNVGYGVPMKHGVAVLLLLSLIVVGPAMNRVIGALLTAGPLEAVELRPLLGPPRADRVARMAGAVFGGFLIYWHGHLTAQAVAGNRASEVVPLRGVWQVVRAEGPFPELPYRRGSRPSPDYPVTAAWASISVLLTDRAVIRRLDGSTVYFTPAIDTASRVLRFVRYGSPDSEAPLTFEYTQENAAHLVLRLADSTRPLALELRRLELGEFPLLASRHRWTW